ncbi:30S ribosomal protein S9 [Pyrodictium occultum]|uniref:Small ribosomal subunit protein uS9 n=1 Tax=Pyrodictium occultum TaxID=2309 RepID=A0A0V8RX61_PYROC|nr:30S ribosomal protein S9 [Pyrodictium occultum]KSW12625.1 30S ribosomal protein S9 [Pyrodictium occultum]
MQAEKPIRIVVSTGKRKTSIARAVIKPGKGRVWVNGVPVEIWPIEMARWKMMEPLLLAGEEIANSVDIRVTVRGGGYMSQADAVRMAIARGLVAYTGSEELRKIYEEYDRSMLAGDPRQTEPEKPMRRSARRRWQKSYR